jgi:starch synthase
MKILFVASEVAPFAKTGGLADVTGSLPKELKRMGHDVRIILPYYSNIATDGFAVSDTGRSVEVQVGGRTEVGHLWQAMLDGIPVYLLKHDGYFRRKYLYGTPKGDYPDNAKRFAFFSKSVLALLADWDFGPEVLHCHDWQSALVPILMKHEYNRNPLFKNIAVVFTIHNLAYQGLFPPKALDDMGLDHSYFSIDRLEYYGKVNLMKGAILSADLVNTVSETYRGEILTADQGCGLEGVLTVRGEDLSGILNGLDYGEWDPAADRQIFCNFSATDPAGKGLNKAQLQSLLGFPQSDGIPLIGMISRLSAQKGFDLIAELLPNLLKRNIQLVVLGDGEEKYVRLIKEAAGPTAGNISFHFGFDLALARRIYAGCDMFLMPSRYEPCGLGQLIALRYGAVPVVRKTGGLADTVFDPADSTEPTGFSFSAYDSGELRQTLMRAIAAWQDKERWQSIMQRGMSRDFSWQASAKRYVELYRRGITRKRS